MQSPDIASEETLLALTYVEAVSNAGIALTARELDAYMKGPKRRRAVYETPGPIQVMARALQPLFMNSGSGAMLEPPEPWQEYLQRLGWVDTTMRGTMISPLGRAVLAHIRAPRPDSASGAPLTVVIDPSDPFAYARVFAAIGDAGTGLLIDPYLRFEQFSDLLLLGTVNRILTGDNKWEQRAPQFLMGLRGSRSDAELRYLPQKDLHDRFFVSDAGAVLLLGSSLNSIAARPGVIAPLHDSKIEVAVRNAYEEMWSRASPLDGSDMAELPT